MCEFGWMRVCEVHAHVWWSEVNIECQPQLRQGLSLNLKFTYSVRLGGQQVPGVCLCLSSSGCPYMWIFMCTLVIKLRSWSLTLEPQAISPLSFPPTREGISGPDRPFHFHFHSPSKQLTFVTSVSLGTST